MSSTTSTSSTPTARPLQHSLPQPADSAKRHIPVTPALLRSIFASSRTPNEERSISRIAFFRLAAARGRGIKSSTALLGVV
ncbi:uncharacterized protein BT62DRAFT_1002618 [Guyanagaster necrorhizus]|uniref:Uncharacterized protein n=1 Tax=Guyanagaster necrorhizus TaxID=856835 RepID=A0A9P7VXK0_9AGAR|nr:uncharacterized protein BT62DRAFT_1002618 [Guyanagaster necrorhizus MCA 3950]KAG7449068.1 hypothetical protein BT62DRAFT_1002618 [Guyanagaster necrorhizus MCA 3950]